MAGKLIEVNTNTLKADISEIENELRAILQCAEKLSATLGQLEGMWDGNAKQSFSLAVRDDLNRLKDLVKAMQNLTSKTGTAREEYDRCESTVSQIIASIRV